MVTPKQLMCFLARVITSIVVCGNQIILFNGWDDNVENLTKGLMVTLYFHHF